MTGGQTIAHLIETDGPGGAERLVGHLVSHLAARGFHNVVLLPEQGEGWLATQLPKEGVDVALVPLRGVSLFTSYRAIRSTLQAHAPAVVHSHEFTMAVLGGCAAWRLRIPHLFTMHGGRYYAARWDRRIATACVARTASAIVAVSDTVAGQLQHDLWGMRSRIRVIPNGVPDLANEPATLRRELGLAGAAKLVVTVGNLYIVKGHADLIRAMAAAAAELPWPVHLAIAGRGPEEGALRELARSLGYEDRLHLLGLRNDVPNVLRSGDVFALSSHSEGLPLAVLEAMRAGRPIVATAVGQVPVVLEHGAAGDLVPPADVGALTDRIKGLLSDPARSQRLALRASAVARERYGLEQMVDRYLAEYGAALGSGPKTPPRSPRPPRTPGPA